jgi:hypothetical protein
MVPPERAAVLGAPVALVGYLVAQPYHRPARNRFALAPSRLLGNLAIRLMRPLAWRTLKDQWRGPRDYSLRPALFFHRFIKTSDEGRFRFICAIFLPSFR